MNNIVNKPPNLPIFIEDNTLCYDIITNDLEFIHNTINKLSIKFRLDIFFNFENFTYNIKSYINDDFKDILINIYSTFDENNNFKNYKIYFSDLTIKYFKKLNNNSLFLIEKFLNDSNIINKKKLKDWTFVNNLNNMFVEDDNELKQIHINTFNKKVIFIINNKYIDGKINQLINLKDYIKINKNNLQYFTYNNIIIPIHKLKNNIINFNDFLNNDSFDNFFKNNFLRLISCIYKNIIFILNILILK